VPICDSPVFDDRKAVRPHRLSDQLVANGMKRLQIRLFCRNSRLPAGSITRRISAVRSVSTHQDLGSHSRTHSKFARTFCGGDPEHAVVPHPERALLTAVDMRELDYTLILARSPEVATFEKKWSTDEGSPKAQARITARIQPLDAGPVLRRDAVAGSVRSADGADRLHGLRHYEAREAADACSDARLRWRSFSPNEPFLERRDLGLRARSKCNPGFTDCQPQ